MEFQSEGTERVAPAEEPYEIRTYGEVRDEVQNGDVLCFSGRGFISTVIRKMTRSEYSHVGLVYLFEGRKYCLEAVGSGVRLALLSELVRRYDGEIDYFEMLDVTKDQRCKAIGFGFQQLGKLYDKPGLFRFFWYLVTGRKPKAALDERWFCSEIVAYAYGCQGIELCPVTADYTSPNDLANSKHLNFRYNIKKG
jgi:uncharacterized protein YycO